MFSGFFASFDEHFVEFAGFLSFLIKAYYGFYSVASTFETSFCYPLVYCFNKLSRKPKLNLSQTTFTVNNNVYKTLKPFPEEK